LSEYQYYGFLAIDRPLDAEAQKASRGLSSRAVITTTSFTNEYNYGNFRGDPDALIERFFSMCTSAADPGRPAASPCAC
jgi:hypothetical protein